MQLLTPEDRSLSPLTGYTRAHWLEIAGRLVAGVMRYVDRQTGLPILPKDPRETALDAQLRNPGGVYEAFDRTMLLAAIYAKAAGRTTVDGFEGDILDGYRRSMRHFLFGGGIAKGDRFPFRAGSILAMLLAPELLVDPLDAATRRALAENLAGYVESQCKDNNTMLFKMMPGPLIERLGGAYNRALLDDYFDTILSMYRGDGWFIDGWNRGFDHYNFWGFQLYLHALVLWDERWRGQYAERIREMTVAHERTVPCYFGRDGGPIPKGRSLNYRFAVNSGLGFSQLSGLGAMSPGLARRISSGCLRYFWDRGCLSERGLLERGFLAANTAVGEDYTDTGAPYFAATGLIALALPDDHRFWTAGEEPMPADSPGVKRCAMPGAQMVLKVDGDRGEARMITAGEPFFHRRVWQAGSKYYQHAYSSTLGHALAGDLGPEQAAGRTGLSADGVTWSYRTWPRAVEVTPTRVRSEWDAWPADRGLTGTVVTETLILDHGEVHVFWHTAAEPRWLTIGGYAIRLDHGERPMMDAPVGGLTVSGDAMWSVLAVLRSGPGRFTMEEVRPRAGFLHSHLFEGWAAYPQWTSSGPVPPGAKMIAYVDAARRAETLEIETPEITVDESTGELTVRAGGEAFVV